MDHRSCCAPPSSAGPAHDGGRPAPRGPFGSAGVGPQIVVPAGSFRMGDAFGEGYPADGETPVHEVSVGTFTMDATAVTAAEFARFVDATGYRTQAEAYGTSAVFHLLADADPSDVLGAAVGVPWWLTVRGADWAHPQGRRSHWSDEPDHPAVHVSWFDAQAYCEWAGRRLPTEAECEYAARGGLDGARYAWGDDLTPGGEHRCNIWQGTFPTVNTAEDGYVGTAPVASFPANGYGFHDMAGNVWEWCSDWFHARYYRLGVGDNPPGARGRGAPCDARGFLPVPRVVLQPVPGCCPELQHARVFERELRFPHGGALTARRIGAWPRHLLCPRLRESVWSPWP